MNKRCARCDKTVYPTEELKCLDKVIDLPKKKPQMCRYAGFNIILVKFGEIG